jgi:hypothetical protein
MIVYLYLEVLISPFIKRSIELFKISLISSMIGKSVIILFKLLSL